jgi:hypothetical protein
MAQSAFSIMPPPFQAASEPDGSSRTPCPRCNAREVVLGTLTERFTYLRCAVCAEVWAIPERRRFVRVLQKGVPSAPLGTEKDNSDSGQ